MPVIGGGSSGSALTVATMYQLAGDAHGWSRSNQEIYAAISAGALRVYQWIKKEAPQSVFLVEDTSSVVLAAGVDEYALPTNLSQILSVRERVNAQDEWRIVLPAQLDYFNRMVEQFSSLVDFDGAYSAFKFLGPYLKYANVDDGVEAQMIRIAPVPIDARQIELVYAGKWVEIVDNTSKLCVPIEGRHAALDFAIAQLMQRTGDPLMQTYEASGWQKLKDYLHDVREKQKAQRPSQQPYIDDLD